MPFASPSPGVRQRKKLATRTALENAALELFAEKGFEATTVEEIAARVGVSRRTFFRYFETKEDVVYSRAADHLHTLREMIGERRRAGAPPLEAVKEALPEFAEYLATDARLIGELTRVVVRSPQLRARRAAVSQGWVEAVEAELATGGPPELVHRLVAAMAITVMTYSVDRWALEGGDLPELVASNLARVQFELPED